MKNGRTSRRVCRTNTDPTSALTSIIQKHLATLHKQQKFETRTDFQLYPSNPIPPRLYGVIKAHKHEKCYLMRAIVSTIGTQPYAISQYLLQFIQPTLNKSKYKITRNEAKNWLVKRNEIKVSYNNINLYTSVPINKALDVLIDQVNNDKDDLMKRAKLCLKDIYELAELCLSKFYFIFIGLSFMVVLSKSYVQNLEHKATAEALTLNLALKTYRQYVDDIHARFTSNGQSPKFQNILNKHDKHIQFTVEDEN